MVWLYRSALAYLSEKEDRGGILLGKKFSTCRSGAYRKGRGSRVGWRFSARGGKKPVGEPYPCSSITVLEPYMQDWMIIKGQAFLLSYYSVPRPPPPPSPVSKLDRRTHRKTEKERQFADGWGVRWRAWSQIIRKLDHLLIIQNSLSAPWVQSSALRKLVNVLYKNRHLFVVQYYSILYQI